VGFIQDSGGIIQSQKIHDESSFLLLTFAKQLKQNKMKKMILMALLFAGTLSASAEELTVKELIAKATSSETIQKVKDFLATPQILKIVDELNTDLKFDIESNKLIITSQANFNYIKVDGKKLPKKASVKVEAFGLGVKISKKAGAFMVEKI
jgi:hypothetical protein